MVKQILLFLLIFGSTVMRAQEESRYWVFFSDKNTENFDPASFFDAKALERRHLQQIPLDELDAPVNESYLSLLRSAADSVYAVSRWLNGAVAGLSPEALLIIEQWPFVTSVEALEPMQMEIASIDDELDEEDVALLDYQTRRLEIDVFQENGFTGEGVRVAIFDAGFPGVDNHQAFEHIRAEGRIIKTYDFIKKREDVYGNSSHGTAVLSCIAGKYGDMPMGLAPDAEFLLARTERASSEWFVEEYNWITAAEWADQNGAQIINSSLGYTEQRYFPEQMTGRHSYIAKAANIAAKKGILIVNAAGNEGFNRWGTLVTPADADSVLAVGGTNPYEDAAVNFTSFGPAKSGALKPNVSAPGIVIGATKTGYGRTQGTSFASPLVAGFAAALWQAFPHLTANEIFRKIEESGHLYPYFDYVHGYGIPIASKALGVKDTVPPTFTFEETENFLDVKIDSSFLDTLSQMNLYYHVKDYTGRLTYYAVVSVYEEVPVSLDLHDVNGTEVVVHFEGFTSTYIIKRKEE